MSAVIKRGPYPLHQEASSDLLGQSLDWEDIAHKRSTNVKSQALRWKTNSHFNNTLKIHSGNQI